MKKTNVAITIDKTLKKTGSFKINLLIIFKAEVKNDRASS